MSLINVSETSRAAHEITPQIVEVTSRLDCYENETDFIKQFG